MTEPASPPTVAATSNAAGSTAEIEALAVGFFAAVESGDTTAIAAMYAPDAIIWHNTDQRKQTVTENLAVLGWLVSHVSDLRYTEVQRKVLDDGFVQQHVLRGTGPKGPLVLPAMVRVWVRNGAITRLDEYVDSAHVADLT